MNLPPPSLSNPSTWLGPEMSAREKLWIWELAQGDIKAIELATKNFIQQNIPLAQISKDNFLCPELDNRLKQLKYELIEGRGFSIIRGLDVSRYTRKEMATMFMGLGSYIGSPRSQNASGHLLGHVRDVGADAEDQDTRIYQTNSRQTFHTDSCDVVALCCLNTAKQGGESLLVSGESIYNKMMGEDPKLTRLLFNPIATDKRGEVEPGQKPYFTIPVFTWFDEKLTTIYQRQYIDSAQRFDDVLVLSKSQIIALDLFDKTANNPSLNFSMQLQSGDMQFVHNHSMLHDRGGFVDWPKLKDRRHLLRLWLTVPDDRKLPPVFEQRFGTTEIGNRGGVIVDGTELQVLLD